MPYIAKMMDALPQADYPPKIESSFNNKLTQALNYYPHKDKRNQNESEEEQIHEFPLKSQKSSLILQADVAEAMSASFCNE